MPSNFYKMKAICPQTSARSEAGRRTARARPLRRGDAALGKPGGPSELKPGTLRTAPPPVTGQRESERASGLAARNRLDSRAFAFRGRCEPASRCSRTGWRGWPTGSHPAVAAWPRRGRTGRRLGQGISRVQVLDAYNGPAPSPGSARRPREPVASRGTAIARRGGPEASWTQHTILFPAADTHLLGAERSVAMSPGAPGALGRRRAGCRTALIEADAAHASHVAIVQTSAARAAISWLGTLHLRVSAEIY